MKVVHLTTAAESLRFVQGHIGVLRSRGIEVHTISSPSPELAEYAAQHDVVTHSITMQRQISIWKDLKSLWQLYQKLRVLRPSIVHAHTPKAGLLGMVASFLARVPIRVYHIHGLPLVTAGGIKRRVLRACDQVACTLASKVYCVSSSLRELVDEEGIFPRSRLSVLGNGSISGIDARRQYCPSNSNIEQSKQIRASLGIPLDALVIGFVGRIVVDKGIHELLDAWRELRAEFDCLRLLVVGPKETANAISAAADAQLEGDRRVHCVGFQENAAPYYTAMDLLAFPTYREGFGLVATEASAMQVPVVASHIPGCVDAVEDGVTGTLVPAKDASALSQALRRYLSDDALRERHGQAGRERVLRDFQPSRIEQELWEDYVILMRQHGLERIVPENQVAARISQAA